MMQPPKFVGNTVKLDTLSPEQLALQLRCPGGLALQVGPFIIRIHSMLEKVVDGVRLHYADFPLAPEEGFSDFHVRVAQPGYLRRWIRPQVQFYIDGNIPFKPLPLVQAFPMFEWGFNWCISNYDNQHLIIHAAVVEKDGCAVIMPAPPGSGKSTLCAGLVNRGWRLLSDELTLVSRAGGHIVPLPRPVNLKNASIEVIRNFAPQAVIGQEAKDTAKGTVAHMRPPVDSVRRADEKAMPAWVVFPRYEAGAAACLEVYSRARTLVELAENSFNYSVLGLEGFRLLGQVVDACDCYRFSYSDLDDAVDVFNGLSLLSTRP